MPRHHGRRQGIPPLALSPNGYRCLGGDAPVSAARTCCPKCWGRLSAALKDALSVPEGTNPHDITSPQFLASKALAARWLANERQMAR